MSDSVSSTAAASTSVKRKSSSKGGLLYWVDRLVGIVTAFYCFFVLLFSSLLLNAAQFLCFRLYFLSYTQRLSLSQELATKWWELFPFLTEVWAAIPYVFTGSFPEEVESSILIGNHERGMDFTTGISIITRAGKLGCGKMMTMMKQSLAFVPTIGWTHYFQGSLFMRRSWEKDQINITNKLQEIETGIFPKPVWIGIYPEGTRITPKKREESIKFAQSRGLPQLNNVLLPRTKGFTFLLHGLPTAIESIIDATCGYAGSPMYPWHPFILGRFATEAVHIHLQRFTTAKDVPKEEKEQADWLLERFVHKDKLLEEFNTTGHFPGQEQTKLRTRFTHLRTVFAVWAIFVTLAWTLVFGCSSTFVIRSFTLLVVTLALTFVRQAQAQKKAAKKQN